MPTPRAHGGAALEHIPLNLPAFKGLNTEARSAVLGPEWATKLENTVLDTANRIASRKGWNNQTTTANTDAFTQVYEYLNGANQELIAISDADEILKSTNDGGTWTDITGTASITDDNLQFAVLNNILYGFQDGDDPIVYTGTGNATSSTAVNVAKGNAAIGAFGRLWAKDSASVVKWCALLDGADWDGSDTGTIDLTSVWQEQDEITALAEFNGALVIFSQRNIVVYTDGAGSALGIDPLQIVVVDAISGIGCIARDSVVNVKGDLWFLDATGVHSLGRLLQQKSNPINNLSKNIQEDIQSRLLTTTEANIRAVYSPQDRFYLLSFPAGSGTTETGAAYCLDTRGFLEDGATRVSGIWSGLVPTAAVVRDNLDLFIARRQNEGEIGRYEGYFDDAASYVMDYESAWGNLNNGDLKILKRITGQMFVQSSQVVTFKWAFDFQENVFKTADATFTGGGAPSEFNVAEFAVDEFGTGVAIREKNVGGRGTGEYVKIGFTVTIDGEEIAVQQISLYAKIGRLK